jgi:hypothetical protein
LYAGRASAVFDVCIYDVQMMYWMY